MLKNNLNAKGEVENYKSFVEENDYSQVEGIDFGDIVLHVVKLNSIRFILSITTILILK